MAVLSYLISTFPMEAAKRSFQYFLVKLTLCPKVKCILL